MKKTTTSRQDNHGEIATTLTLITLGIMLLGTFLGTRQAVRQNVQKFLSSADSGSLCYQSGSCRNTTDTTSCGPTMECKNVSKTPFQNDYRCVTRGVSCTVSSPQSCWCLGTLTPTIIPTPSTTLRASPTPTTMLTSSPSSKDSSRLPQLFLTPTPVPTAKVEVISAPPVSQLTPAAFSCPFESQSRLYEVDSQKAQQKNIDLTGENLPKWGLASFKTTASPPGSPQVTFDKNGFYQTGKLNLTPNARGQYSVRVFYDKEGAFEIVPPPNSKYCDGAICPRPFNFGEPADTAQNLVVDCGKSGAYGWIFKRKPVGKMNLRIELSAGRDLSGNILYNVSEFRVDPANLSGNLTLTGVNNSIVKTLLFTATNGVVNVTFDNIPAGQYKVSLNMPNGQGLRDEYTNEVESSYYDKNSVKRYIWKTVKAHLLNKSLYNETGKVIDTLYITPEATSIVRVIYDTNPAAGLVYTSNDACIQCQQEYCREDNYCTVKSEGRISGWNKFWCVAKFKKNGNGDPVQQPDGFFKSCKGEPPTGGGATGCWCTNDTDCSIAAGKREVAPGQNYCRETGDIVCCVGGAKPSADQQKPNRCCSSDSDCNKFFNDGSKCSGGNSDCGSGKSCTIPQPTATPRPNANPSRTPTIAPTLMPGCGLGFAPNESGVARFDGLPVTTPVVCPLHICNPGEFRSSNQCANPDNRELLSPCLYGERKIFQCVANSSYPGGAEPKFVRCQRDQSCPTTFVENADKPFSPLPPIYQGTIDEYPESIRPILRVCQDAVDTCNKCGNYGCTAANVGTACRDLSHRCSEAVQGKELKEIAESLNIPINVGLMAATAKACTECATATTIPGVNVILCTNCIATLAGESLRIVAANSRNRILYIPERCQYLGPTKDRPNRSCQSECYAPSTCLAADGKPGGQYCCPIISDPGRQPGPIETVINQCASQNCDACEDVSPDKLLQCLVEKKIDDKCFKQSNSCAEISKQYAIDTQNQNLLENLTTTSSCIVCSVHGTESIAAIVESLNSCRNCATKIADIFRGLITATFTDADSATLTLDTDAAPNIDKVYQIKLIFCDQGKPCYAKTISPHASFSESAVPASKGSLIQCVISFVDGSTKSCGTFKINKTSRSLLLKVDGSENHISLQSAASRADVNGDKEVNTIDYVQAIKGYDSNEKLLDATGDGLVNALDISQIVLFLGEKVDSYIVQLSN